jgi:hypothetical protein
LFAGSTTTKRVAAQNDKATALAAPGKKAPEGAFLAWECEGD